MHEAESAAYSTTEPKAIAHEPKSDRGTDPPLPVSI